MSRIHPKKLGPAHLVIAGILLRQEPDEEEDEDSDNEDSDNEDDNDDDDAADNGYSE
jgi:hypothetical protein